MNLVFIYGPPGVGKLTVGTELARLTGYKLWHNHVSIDAVLPVFGWGMPSFTNLVRDIRSLVLAEAAAQSVDLITTFAYAHPEDIPLAAKYFDPYELHGGRVCAVQLLCDSSALDDRVQSDIRAAIGKVATTEQSHRMHEQYDLSTPIPGRDSLRIDNTNLAPIDVARLIAGHYALPTPASDLGGDVVHEDA